MAPIGSLKHSLSSAPETPVVQEIVTRGSAPADIVTLPGADDDLRDGDRRDHGDAHRTASIETRTARNARARRAASSPAPPSSRPSHTLAPPVITKKLIRMAELVRVLGYVRVWPCPTVDHNTEFFRQ